MTELKDGSFIRDCVEEECRNTALIENLITENAALRAELAALKSANGWRKCHEELPPFNSRVHVFTSFGDQYIAILCQLGECDMQWNLEASAYYSGENFDIVTHWRELPTPPEVE